MRMAISSDEISKFHELTDAAVTAEGVCELIQWIIDRNQEGRAFWGNRDFESFMLGMKLGVGAFLPSATGEFAEIEGKGAWRVIAEVILMGLELE